MAPENLKVRDVIFSGPDADIQVGNTLPLANIPVGTMIHNIEMKPGAGGQLVRSAGNGAQLMAKEHPYAQIRLPSGEVRRSGWNAEPQWARWAMKTIRISISAKAGKKRRIWEEDLVRGSAMNPNDHPHGGGEGKTGVGLISPVSPWETSPHWDIRREEKQGQR